MHGSGGRHRDSTTRGYVGIEYVWIDWEHCNEVDNLSETILWRDFFTLKTGRRRQFDVRLGGGLT